MNRRSQSNIQLNIYVFVVNDLLTEGSDSPTWLTAFNTIEYVVADVNPVKTIGPEETAAFTKLSPFKEYKYVVIGEPLNAPATNATFAPVVVVVMVPIVGGEGTLYIGTNNLGKEGNELPTSFTAMSDILYDKSLVNPVILNGETVEPTLVVVAPPSNEYK